MADSSAWSFAAMPRCECPASIGSTAELRKINIAAPIALLRDHKEL